MVQREVSRRVYGIFKRGSPSPFILKQNLNTAIIYREQSNLADALPEVIEVMKLSPKQVDNFVQLSRRIYAKLATVTEERKSIAFKLGQVLLLHHVEQFITYQLPES